MDAMNATFEDVGIIRQGVDAFLRQDGGHLPLRVSIVFLTDTDVKVIKASANGVDLANDFRSFKRQSGCWAPRKA